MQFKPYPITENMRKPRVEDPDDIRLAKFALNTDDIDEVRPGDCVLIGYPDDRGVSRNGGRIGAKDGPDQIRKFLYTMTPGPGVIKNNIRLVDFGNLNIDGLSLAAAHGAARNFIEDIRAIGAKIVTLGGGHDWAYPDFVDFKESFMEETMLINFDAHLDMRPQPQDPEKQDHSGTPFRKILEQSENQLLVVGLQEHCNAISHIEWAEDRNVAILNLKSFETLGSQDQFNALSTRVYPDKKIGLSLDLDVFSAAHSPGVSAPQAFGLDPQIVLRFLEERAHQINQFGIYEYNPTFDRDGQTARLAAKLIHAYLNAV